MCSIELAMAGIKVASAVSSFQGKKQKANQVAQSNLVAKENASRGYMNDLGYLGWQRTESAEELSRSKFKIKIKKIAMMAEQLNLNVGNPNAIFRDLGAEAQLDEHDTNALFNKDIVTLARKEQEAFGAYEKTINNLPVPYQPSMMGLGIQLASAGAGYYKDVQDLELAKGKG